MRKLVENEDAFTGLEAAIVLIAFIVVAAVFSYVMLGAGFFATGEAQRTVHTGVGQATSNLEVAGPVVVKAGTSVSDTIVKEIAFFLQLAAGGASVDMDKVTFTVSTTGEVETFTYKDVEKEWYVDGAQQTGGTGSGGGEDDMLDKFESVKITVKDKNPLKLPTIKTNARFTVEVKPDIGAALPINRLAPPNLKSGNYYEVY